MGKGSKFTGKWIKCWPKSSFRETAHTGMVCAENISRLTLTGGVEVRWWERRRGRGARRRGGGGQRGCVSEEGEGREAGGEGAQHQDETQGHHLHTERNKTWLYNNVFFSWVKHLFIRCPEVKKRKQQYLPWGMSLFELRPFYKNGEQLSLKSMTEASGAAVEETWRKQDT